MLAAVWATTSGAANLRRLVKAISLASMEVWRISITGLVKKLPEDVQEVLRHAGESKEFESPEYEAAMEVFYKRHFSHRKKFRLRLLRLRRTRRRIILCE